MVNTPHLPCNFDHNGECLVCDCWPSDCAYKRYVAGDGSYESKVQLECMFGWKSLRNELPLANELVYWYDAMFDNIMHFKLPDPKTHDGDFSHFARAKPINRPEEHNLSWGYKQVGWCPPCQFSHSWTTQEGLEELGKHEFIDFEQVMDWVNVPIYEHPVLYKARMTMQRNRAVVRRMRNAAH